MIRSREALSKSSMSFNISSCFKLVAVGSNRFKSRDPFERLSSGTLVIAEVNDSIKTIGIVALTIVSQHVGGSDPGLVSIGEDIVRVQDARVYWNLGGASFTLGDR